MPNVLISELDASPALVGTDVIMVQHAAGPPAEQSTIAAIAAYTNSTAATGIILASGAAIRSAGNFTLGNGTALATNATVGFFMIPSCAGVPSGAPIGFGAGNVPVIWDSTNFRMYAYTASGAWKMAQFA